MIEEKGMQRIAGYFKEVELTEEYKPYFCSIGDAITIVIIGTFCGFRNLKQIHMWASHEKITGMLQEKFGIKHVPCYYWLTCLLAMLEPKSVSECFTRWVISLLPQSLEGQTVAFDGKTICSTSGMECYEAPLLSPSRLAGQ